MRTVSDRAVVLDVLAELERLGGDRQRIAELRDRLESDRLRVLVAGEAKRGKSTVVNALVGRAVLPVGVTPLTAVATVVRHGTDEHVRAEFAHGRAERRRLADLPELVTEPGNPGNRLGLARVVVYLDADVLARGVEIVDTPGTGSVFGHDAEAEQVVESTDAAVFVLTADPPVSAADRELLHRVAERSVAVFVLMNKADRLDAAEREEAVAFAAEHVGREVRVRPVVARAGMDDPGFAAFVADFTSYLETARSADLAESVTRHAARIAAGLVDEVRLGRRAAQMREGEAARRVELFRQRLAAVAARRRDAVDVAQAEGKRLLAALNEAAETDARRLTDRIRAEVTAGLDGASAAEIEQDGRRRLVELTGEAVEDWRDAQRGRLEDGLTAVDARLTGALNRELADVRQAAAELLDLELAVPETEGRLVEDPRFFYIFAERAGQTELLAGAIRRHLPGEFGRRRAREHLLGEAAELVPKQVGRARADLQYRLGESTRALVRAIEARYAGTADRLLSVLDAADHPSEDGQGLDDREAALTGLLDRLSDQSRE